MKSADLLITGGRVWDGEKYLSGDVAVAGGKIVSLGNRNEFDARYVYSAEGKLVTPGLVDIHTHLLGLSSDEFGTAADLGCVPFGVTAAADCDTEQGSPELLRGFTVRTRVFIALPYSGTVLNEKAAENMLTRFGSAAAGFKLYYDTAVFNPAHTLETLRAACRLARKHGVKLCVHCSHSPISMAQLVRELAPGDILTHIFHGDENTAAEDGFACLREAQKRGVLLDTGFAGHVHMEPAVFLAAIQSGLRPNTVSTDLTRYNAFTRGGPYGMTMCMSMCRAAGMTEEEILPCVTKQAAEAIGMPDAGRLYEGSPADIAVLDETGEAWRLNGRTGSLSGSESYRCRLTVSGGRIVYKC